MFSHFHCIFIQYVTASSKFFFGVPAGKPMSEGTTACHPSGWPGSWRKPNETLRSNFKKQEPSTSGWVQNRWVSTTEQPQSLTVRYPPCHKAGDFWGGGGGYVREGLGWLAMRVPVIWKNAQFLLASRFFFLKVFRVDFVDASWALRRSLFEKTKQVKHTKM